MSRQLARAREAEETVVASGTSRFYQRRSAITSGIVVSNEKQTDPEIDSRIDEYGHFQREERRAGITPFKVLFPIGAVLFVGFWTWALFFCLQDSCQQNRRYGLDRASRGNLCAGQSRAAIYGIASQSQPYDPL